MQDLCNEQYYGKTKSILLKSLDNAYKAHYSSSKLIFYVSLTL